MHLLLDIDGVLQFQRADFIRQVQKLGWKGDYGAFLSRVFANEDYLATLEGRGDVREVMDQLLRDAGETVSGATLLDTWASTQVTFNAEILDALPRLSTSSLHLATNQEALRAQRIREEYVARPGIHGLFISCELGARKPFREYFQQVLQALDCAPDQAVFVDDLIENVQGARNVGMHGIHYTSNADLFERLAALDIRPHH